MAGRLTELTGINPFTVNQEMMTEKSSTRYENPYYKMVDVRQPSLFVNENGEIFAGPFWDKPRFDARLFHSRTNLIYGRADWLFLDGKRKPYQLKPEIVKMTPCLVLAYYENEDIENAVPADVIEITSKQSPNTLVLYPGNYKILIKDTQGNTDQKLISIK
ncbi:hypothetical protein LZG74_16420 [Dyadobacter sp. CY327]|uniref:hypothetical protein n=1 Tax=Dyadobacter sp. CY327 TaxID=2907301 RepID=UPI001F2A62AC|nr:hypothetical protein [Dyadobacter sp. CY327]MCE7071905.1 hypothetical protein [Dyadobacter sp. CY327]